MTIPMNASNSVRGAAGQKPTRVRYWVILFSITLAILAYIDRASIGMAAPFMRKDLNLDTVQMGYVFSAFALAYALFEIPGGWMGDWLGPKRVLIRIVLWWSLFTVATGWAWSFVSLLVIRFLFGVGEAGCFPNLTKAMTIWLPQRERVKAQGIMWTFARWGGAFTPPLMVLVIPVHVLALGLRPVRHRSGLVWCAFFLVLFKDNPRDHKGVNAAELALLEASGEDRLRPRPRALVEAGLLADRVDAVGAVFPDLLPVLLLPDLAADVPDRGSAPGHRTRLPASPSSRCCLPAPVRLVSGMISARVARWTGSVSRARRALGVTGFFVAGLVHPAPHSDSGAAGWPCWRWAWRPSSTT